MFCSGLQSGELSDVLMSKAYDTEEGLLSNIRDYLGVNAERSVLFKSQRVPTIHSRQTYKEAGNVIAVSNKSASIEQYKKPDMSNAFKKNYNKTEVKCYNSQLLGYFSRNCPEPRKPL